MWDSSYVSTGVYDEAGVNNVLGGSTSSTLGNGETGYGYAIKNDAYAHTGTASAGDTIDYQIISTLPSITSEATYLSCYTFIDTLSAGLTYTKGDVTLEIFSDAACKNPVTGWKEADGYFTVSYNDTKDGKTAMTVEMTAKGLAEINKSKTVYADAGMVNSGFSDCTVRLTYTAKVDRMSWR